MPYSRSWLSGYQRRSYNPDVIDIFLVALLLIVAAVAAANVLSLTTLPVLITACGIILTWRIGHANRRVAERKLFIDLMSRRAEWYDRVRLALEGRARERVEHVDALFTASSLRDPIQLSKLWQLETEAGWLFDAEMTILMAKMLEVDQRLYFKQSSARGGNTQSAREATQLYLELTEAQGAIQDYLVRYLYVGDIGKPSSSPAKLIKKNWLRRLGK